MIFIILTNLSLIVALVCYVLATALVVRFVRSKPQAISSSLETSESAPAAALNTGPSLKVAITIGFIAAVSHAFYASKISIVNGELNLGGGPVLILISCILVCLYIIGSLLMPIKRLGILVFPITLICLLSASLMINEASENFNQHNQSFNGHILISILAFAVLAIAAIQALLYAYQEKQIKLRTSPALLMALPPLQTMEQLLFRLVGVGFVLLSLTLLTGAAFSQEIFGHAFVFKHHTILALMGWVVFAILLFKRATSGVRGSQAVAWTIGGFLLIKLGYFGTKIISQSLAMT